MKSPDQIHESLAETLRSLCSQRRLQHKEIAEAMAERGFSQWRHQQTVGMVLRGARKVSAAELVGLADIFGCSVGELLSEPGPMQSMSVTDRLDRIETHLGLVAAMKPTAPRFRGVTAPKSRP
jgi:transcriptional regulator with XRE-family HTH domain